MSVHNCGRLSRRVRVVDESNSHFASVIGRIGFQECSKNPVGSPLGKLGRHVTDDSDQASSSCRCGAPSFGRRIGISKFASCQSSRNPFGGGSRFRCAPVAKHEASSRLEQEFRAHSLFPQMGPSERAMVSGACVAFSTSPSSLLTQIESPLFRVFLQRRLRLPLPLSQRFCGCGNPFDSLGHHRATCSRTSLWRVRRFVRNVDLGVPRTGDNRRLEVVVDGVPLFNGRQLAVDTTLVSALKGNGEPRRGAADHDGVALREARRVKESGHTQNSLRQGTTGGRGKQRSSFDCLPEHVPGVNRDSCNAVWSRRGDCAGTPSSRAPRQGRLLRFCWDCGVGVGPTGWHLHPMRSSATRLEHFPIERQWLE